MSSVPNLLDQALGLHDDVSTKASPNPSGRVVLVEDCVDTSGAFVLHHLIKRSLSPHSSSVVVFVALAQPFSHYDRILRKMMEMKGKIVKVAAHGSSNNVLNFMHYCLTLTTQFGCSLIALNHRDIYLGTDGPTLILQMEYLADFVVKAEPLATGLATDVHGQLIVLNNGAYDGLGNSRSKMHNFHFRVKENGAEYFYPGSRA